MSARAVQLRLRELANPTRAAGARSFFKTGPGQYGEGDQFAALEILVMQYEAGDPTARTGVFRFYLQHTDRINNWDLVDTSARYIVGAHLRDRSRARVYRLARSTHVWERRIAVVATHAWIAAGDTADAYAIADLLLEDRHDLIRKAVVDAPRSGRSRQGGPAPVSAHALRAGVAHHLAVRHRAPAGCPADPHPGRLPWPSVNDAHAHRPQGDTKKARSTSLSPVHGFTDTRRR